MTNIQALSIEPDIAAAMRGVYFISGIDTDIGKTVATGCIAAHLQTQRRVITQKLIQTGSRTGSPDIAVHRQIMGNRPFEEDATGLTAPLCLEYPASPHLAAQLMHTSIDFEHITAATHTLAQRYEVVLVEGAGGVLVPLDQQTLTLDYVSAQHYPLILVTCGRLGSINHTLLSLLAIRHYQVPLFAVVFNHYQDASDNIIAADSHAYLKNYLAQTFPTTHWWDLNCI